MKAIFKNIGNTCTLADISKYVSTTNTYESFSSDEEGAYFVYDASGISMSINRYEFANDYVSIIKDGSGVGRLQYCYSKSSIIGTLGAVFPINCSAKFLYSVMQTIDFKRYVTGATIPHVYYKDYKSAIVPFPPQEQQIKIEIILDKLDSRCNAEFEKLSMLENSKKAFLHQLFI